ncbi:DNA topoisomerase III [Streptococcus agalactiae]|nr:DNA topoisomerase III [Streptococcus agalactiae]
MTKPPKRITESQLISDILPKYGLGTQATRATMLQTIQDRGYITKDKKTGQLFPTNKAYLLIHYLYDNEFASPETTGGWELFLSQIGEGEINPVLWMPSKRSWPLKLQLLRKGVIELEDELKTPYLDQYTDNLTAKVTKKSDDYQVYGRNKEVQSVIISLLRRTKNNPILVGEAGVGKSAIVEGITLAILRGQVPEPLKGLTVRSLELSSLMSEDDEGFYC